LRVTLAARRLTRFAAVVTLALLVVLVLAACSTSRTNDHPTGDSAVPNIGPGHIVTEQGQAAAGLYLPIFLIAVAVFVLVEGLVIVIALRFRRRPTDTELPTQTHGNHVLEIVWTLIPALIVASLFVVSTNVLINKVEAKARQVAVTIAVTAFQWQWTFDYPDLGLSYTGAGRQGPEMVVPVGETVHIKLNAADVIHSFYVPQFFYKKDLVPGRPNEFEVLITEPGTYGGQCAEFCGLSHSDMYFTVRAVDRPTYDAWVAAEQEKARATPEPRPSGSEQGPVIKVTAVSILSGFDPKELSAPAGVRLTIDLDNIDTAAPHNIAIRKANPDGTDWIGLPIAAAGQKATYEVPPLPAGTYTFYCSVHANMVGTLTVR
jgi:cytochrome c oxidase subunit II